MSHQGHIPHGHPPHLNQPPHINFPKAPEYKSPQDTTGEVGRAGAMIGKTIRLLVVGTIWPALMGVATVFDLLRMQSAPEGYLRGRRLLLVWVGFFASLIWGSGAIGSLLLTAIWLFTCLVPVVNLAVGGTMVYASPLVFNAIMSPFVPFVAVRMPLMASVFTMTVSHGAIDRNVSLQGLAKPVLAGYSLLDLHLFVDCASFLIPLYLTILATIKWRKLRNAGSGGTGSQVSAKPWTGAQKALLTLGVVVVLLGLPGAPAGQWVMLGLIGWMLRGVTKDTSLGGFEGEMAGSGHHEYSPRYDSYESPAHGGEVYQSAPVPETHTPAVSALPVGNKPGRQGSGPYDVEVIDERML